LLTDTGNYVTFTLESHAGPLYFYTGKYTQRFAAVIQLPPLGTL